MSDERRAPGLRLVLALWLGLALAVALRTVVRPESHTIFPLLSAASAHWWHDQPLYVDYRPLDYFRYPPVFAVAFTPLALLGLTLGGIVWTWLGMLVYALGLWRFLRDVAPGKWTPGRRALFFALGAIGGLRGFWNAQSNALAIGLVLLGVSAWVRRRWWPCAWLLAAAVALKFTPLTIALLLCALCPRPLAPRLGLALLVFFALPFLTRSPGVVAWHYSEWVEHLAGSSRDRWPGFRDAWTVCQVVSRQAAELSGIPWLREPVDSPVYKAVQLLTALAVLLWCLHQGRRCGDRGTLATLTLAMGTAWLMLFGPAAEFATYVFLAPALSWAAVQGFSWKPGRALLAPSLVLIFVLGWGVLTEPFLDAVPWLLLPLPIGTSLFTLWLIASTPRLRNAHGGARADRLALLVTKDERVPRELAA